MAKPVKRRVHPVRRLLTFTEPRLRFDHDQAVEDPKDGLLLFGPPEKPMGIHYGVIGTPDGLRQFEAWAERLLGTIDADPKVASSVMFPGFETAFRTPWEITPRVRLEIDLDVLDARVKNTDPHQRVFDTVDLFADPIRRWTLEEDIKVAVWFVVIPEEVWKLCRPRSTISRADGIEPEVHLPHARALQLLNAPDLFDEANVAAEKHLYENHFHNQLKAKLLDCEAVTQIIRQTTVAPHEFLNRFGKPARKLQDDATIAWNCPYRDLLQGRC